MRASQSSRRSASPPSAHFASGLWLWLLLVVVVWVSICVCFGFGFGFRVYSRLAKEEARRS
jgi:hypothetical protein